ncbi:cytochrome P450 family protein [Ktedonobacter robiniae]|uniref:Cytochrome P450 n=1 Tax=Ktedonobacter robiniae TaxID=2778365 RepID=A0ABQ3UVA5_9CHLR|nr:cytochrome P450 [Ktedonobacter robiniae]GHO56613.1 cytochrome P450 [Ktedonobacter robiniae]
MNKQSDMNGGGVAFNFFSNQSSENPFPLLAMARSMGAALPVPLPYSDGQKAWMITRMEEAVQVLKDNKRFTVDRRAADSKGFFRQREREFADAPGLLGQSMISVDEPDHRRLRGLVSKAFTPKYIQSLRPSIQHIADELLDRVQDQGHMDLVHDYAYPLPINVISDMLGVPKKNREQIRQWSEALATGGPGDEQRRKRIQAFSNYIVELVAEKRKNPQDDLISQLIQAETEGDYLSEPELLSMVGLLIFAGHETTSNLIGIGTLVLLDNPEQLAKLKADMSLIPSAVEELLRINGPVLMPAPRFATEDTELGGQHIGKGDIIITALASANRDETQFSQSDELDIARDLNRHIAFGQGIHICLGAPLARLEGDIAFTTLLRRMPDLRLNVPRESVTWRGSFNLRGLTSLPVAF